MIESTSETRNSHSGTVSFSEFSIKHSRTFKYRFTSYLWHWLYSLVFCGRKSKLAGRLVLTTEASVFVLHFVEEDENDTLPIFGTSEVSRRQNRDCPVDRRKKKVQINQFDSLTLDFYPLEFHLLTWFIIKPAISRLCISILYTALGLKLLIWGVGGSRG